jgi:hypothetical protein
LRPKEQLILPQVTDWLRSKGIQIGTRDVASYVGALRISVSGVALSDVYAGARTATPSSAGGQYGLFTPGVYQGQEASTEAYLYGSRRASRRPRSNSSWTLEPRFSGTLDVRGQGDDRVSGRHLSSELGKPGEGLSGLSGSSGEASLGHASPLTPNFALSVFTLIAAD